MAHNRFTRNPLRILAEADLATLHERTMQVLEKVGVHMDSPEALDLLAAYGVRCDQDKRRAYPGEEHVRRALATARKEYTLRGRHPRKPRDLRVDGTTTHVISGGAALRLYADGAYPTATEEDLVDTTVLHEKLDHVDVLINVVEPAAMDAATLYPVMAAILLRYSSKPLLLQVSGRRDLGVIIRMAALIAGNAANLRARPLFMTGINAEPPLRITREGAEVLIDAARAGIPVSLGDFPMMGSTAPAHLAATLVQRTATVLTGLVLTQAAAPGSIYDFTCHSGACDLRTGDAVTMSPHVLQLVMASVQMGRHYGLNTHAMSCTEARGPDAQAAGERMAALMASITAGAAFIHHGTCCMAGMELADHAQSVIDNELIGQAKAFAAGVTTDGLDPALAALKEVTEDPQYAGLGFLGHPHTAVQCHQQVPSSGLFATGQLARWLSGDRVTVHEKAEEIARAAMAEREEFTPPDLTKELFKLAKESS